MKLLVSSITCLVFFSLSCTTPLPPPTRPDKVTNTARTTACLNLNTSTAEELKALPGIGDTLAQRIIEYRTQHGNFRRPQEIIIIEGFSEKRYRAIADLICVEGGK